MNIFRELGIEGGKDRVNEEVVYSIARAYASIENKIARILAPYGIGTAKFNILLMVKHVGKGKGLPQNHVSNLLLVTTSNITRMIDKLEEDGYVERSAQSNDRRVNLINITRKGSNLLDTMWPKYIETVDSIIGLRLSNIEKRTIVKLTEKLFPYKDAREK
jgi:DNA-binding MarR family transcriptional regulator